MPEYMMFPQIGAHCRNNLFKDRLLKRELLFLIEQMSIIDYSDVKWFTNSKVVIDKAEKFLFMKGIDKYKNEKVKLFFCLGLVYRKNKQFNIAKNYFDAAILNYSISDKNKLIEYANIMENAGINSILSKLVNNNDELFLSYAYKIKKYMYGSNNLETLNTLINYSAILIRQSKYSQAEYILKYLLEKKLIISDHHKRSLCLLNFANVLKCNKSYEKSLEILNHGFELINDKTNIDGAVFLNNIARINLKMMNYDSAVKNFLAAEKICLSSDSRATSSVYLCQTYQGMGSLFLETGDYFHAQLYIRNCSKIQDKLYEDNSPFVINTSKIQKNISENRDCRRKTNFCNVNTNTSNFTYKM